MLDNKPTLVYFNSDCYSQVDDTVLKYLTRDFRVIWFYLFETNNNIRLGVQKAQEYADQNGIELIVVEQTLRMRDFRNFTFYRNLARKMNSYKPDIVYHCDRSPYWALCIRLFLKCKRVIIGIHDAQRHSYDLSISRLLEAATKNLTLKIHKYFITFSKGQHALLKDLHGHDSYMVGMSSKSFGVSNQNREPISHGVKVLFFGSIYDYKGLDILIEAIERLYVKGISNITLTIAGRGPSWEKCEKLIQHKQIFNIQVRFIENSEIPDLFCTHHFLALPYRNATQSGPLVTAIAYKLPLIAPRFGCFSESYDDETAIFYEQEGIDEALQKASTLSDGQYNEYVKHCERLQREYSEEAIAENYISCFHHIMTK